MLLKSIQVKGFRSIADQRIDCDALTVLVGPNGAGKSSFLRAIELFEVENPSLSLEDCHGRDESTSPEVSLTFRDLGHAAIERFKPYVRDGELTVTRVLSPLGGKGASSYRGERLQHPAFGGVRAAEKADDQKRLYGDLRKPGSFPDLPDAKTKAAISEALDQYEREHSEQCSLQRDDGKFFGFKEVAQGYLGRHARVVSIPAVYNAAEATTEGKGSPISRLLDVVVRSALRDNAEITALRAEMSDRYSKVLDPAKIPELKELEKQLSGRLKEYAPDSSLSLPWAKPEPDLPPPRVEVRLSEDGYESDVDHCGHGVQRALIMSLLQQLALNFQSQADSGAADGDTDGENRIQADLILLIEEPELFQHPSRQRHIANVLDRLTSGQVPEAPRVQVIYVTHSPLFVGLDRFDSIRVVRKLSSDAGPRCTSVKRVTLRRVCELLQAAAGPSGFPYSEGTLRSRLQAIMTPWMNEGFFADLVVLVEGEDDRAAILSYASAEGFDCDSQGIAVIPCGGKRSLDRPYIIFRELGILTYLVWDGDQGKAEANPEDNRYLLRLLGHAEEDWPDVVTPTFACFRVRLENTLREEFGSDNYQRLLDEVKAEYGINKNDDALKRPAILLRLIEKARSETRQSKTLSGIVEAIRALRGKA